MKDIKSTSVPAASLATAFAAALVTFVAHGATLTLGDASLSGDQLSVPVTVVGASSGTLTIVAAEAAPRDGEPAISSGSVAASQTISAPGTYSMTFTVTLGTKVAYRAELGGDVSPTGDVIAYDNNEYFYWKAGVEGNWHDKNNWTIGATDGYQRLGYPGYVTKARVEFPTVPADNSQTNIVHIDTSYTIYKLYLNHSYIVARLVGVHGDELLTITGGEDGISQDRVADVTFDHMRVTTQNWPITRNDSLSLVNGAYLTTRWWIHINGANAKLYVGSGSEIRASYEWWYGISLSGENAEIEIDDGYVYTPRLRIGANGQDKPSANQVLTATPKGVVFKGVRPQLEIAQEFASIAEMPNNPVFEFYVPANGFAAAPVVGSPGSGGIYQMLGADYLDNIGSVTNGAPIVFKVNSLSPFFEGSSSDTIVLVDWSAYGNGGIYESRVVFASMDDPIDNYLSYGSAGSSILATLKGNGGAIAHPVLSDVATAEVVDDNLVVSTDVSALPETGTTTARLYIGVAGPNGDPKTNMTLAAESVVSAAGSASLSAEAVLGSQMAYAIVLVYENGGSSWTGSTTTNVMVVSANGTEYVWVNDTAGVWSDPANWTCSATDGKKRLGYPAYGCRVRFYGNQTAVVEVDGPYTGLGDSFMDNTGLNLTMIGTVPGAEVRMSGIRCTDGNNLALDGVALTTGSYAVGDHGSLRLTNGASMTTSWALGIEGVDALLYVGTNCQVRVSNAEPYHRLGLSGENAEIVIDGGTINALYLGIGGYYGSGEESLLAKGEPKGVTFSGPNPQLILRDSESRYKTKVYAALGSSPIFNFIIPEGGYVSTPIMRTGGNGNTLFEQSSADIPAVTFKVDRKSPYLKVRGNFTQQLVDWSTSTAETKLNTGGVVLTDMPKLAMGETIYFTPTAGEAKSGIAADCRGRTGFEIRLR